MCKIFQISLLCLFFSIALLWKNPVFAEDNNRVTLVKVAYLFRFSLFVEWPQQQRSTDFLICVANDERLSRLIQESLLKKQIKNQSIQAISVQPEDDLSLCQLLYIPEEIENTLIFLENAKQFAILTLGESISFYREHGMIYLYERDNKIKFFINIQSVNQSGLEVRAQLMRLSEEPVDES